jgi:hypothetical protein
MKRPLKCNQVNDGGDEAWTDITGATIAGTACHVFPDSLYSPIPVATKLNAASYSVKVTLLADAWIYGTVTDANGCTKTDSVS